MPQETKPRKIFFKFYNNFRTKLKKLRSFIRNTFFDASERNVNADPTHLKKALFYELRQRGKRIYLKSKEVDEDPRVVRHESEKILKIARFFSFYTEQSKQNVFLGDAVLSKTDLRTFGIENRIFNLVTDELSRGSIVVINNNDVAKLGFNNYIELYNNSNDTLFIVWDWDNHHDLNNSMPLAAFSDFFVPAHFDFFAPLAEISSSVSAPIPVGVFQWSRSELEFHKKTILDTNRLDTPLGHHFYYKRFARRNKWIQTLNKIYPDVGPAPHDYHDKNSIQRLETWSEHKAHWIVPVRHDVPIRIFDALITGGIPIVPGSLQYHPALISLKEHIVFYWPSDIFDPKRVTEAAVRKFNESGEEGTLQRFTIAFEKLHNDARIFRILERAQHYFSQYKN